MENISLVSWDDMFVADKRLHAELGWRIDLINLHEMAHTWFGDAVVCRDFAHSWLKESWAVYMEAVWLQDTEGDEISRLHLWEARASYTEESDTRYARPIATRRFDASWDLFDRHLYPGGAWRIHMLRNMLGDEVFWAAVRDYLRSNEGRVVETDDFRRCLERWSGRSLAAFFDQWIFSPGYPKLSAEWSWEAGEGKLQIRQTQADPTKGIGTFPLSLPIQVQGHDGQWTQHLLRMDAEKAELRITLASPPLQVLIDPQATTLHMLHWNPGLPMLQRGLSHAEAWVRVESARHLAATARPAALRSIRTAAAQEPQWMARRIFARLLGNAGTHEAARQLVDWVAQEGDARVLPTLFEALARLRSPEVSPAIRSWLAGSGRGWMATAAALHALGVQRDPQTEDQLIEASQADSWWGWVQKGAAAGLGELRTPGAIQRLVAMLHAPEVQRPGRLAAIEALGPAARNLPPHERRVVWEHLGELVEDPDYAARMATARSLAALGDPEGARWIDQIAMSLASQDRPRVEKLAERLRAQTPGGPQETVQRLEQQLKALQDRLERLEATKEKPS
jgi:aminopeptidase N